VHRGGAGRNSQQSDSNETHNCPMLGQMAEIAALENITDNYVSNLIHLAWLSPRLVDRVLDGEPMTTDLPGKALNSRRASTLWPDEV
jgi:hypothetical protein